jgi:hypothetical protein
VRTVSNTEGWYCIECGSPLAPSHQTCWRCGAARWDPSVPTPSSSSRAESVQPATAAVLGLLAPLYASGGVAFLVLATVALAMLVSPNGRSQLLTENANLAAPSTLMLLFALEGVLLPVLIAIPHGVAFHGLRRMTRWGWLAAVVLASFWSLILLGVPVLVRLLQPDVRRACRVS